MAGVSSMLRPSRLIRRKAMYSGVLGRSKFWKVVAVGLYGQSTLKRFFGRQPEVLDRKVFGSGKTMVVQTERPLSRTERKRLEKSGQIHSIAGKRVDAHEWAEAIVAEKRSTRASSRTPRWKFWKR